MFSNLRIPVLAGAFAALMSFGTVAQAQTPAEIAGQCIGALGRMESQAEHDLDGVAVFGAKIMVAMSNNGMPAEMIGRAAGATKVALADRATRAASAIEELGGRCASFLEQVGAPASLVARVRAATAASVDAVRSMARERMTAIDELYAVLVGGA